MSHSINMLCIQIDYSPLVQQHQIVPFCKLYEVEFFKQLCLIDDVRLLDTPQYSKLGVALIRLGGGRPGI